ncbi:MAG: sugar ABC transporter permease [Candidatus Aerophobus sp.]|nr:MAG: sugar ABC transporter permease [Candidatus Aerophobus sp.]
MRRAKDKVLKVRDRFLAYWLILPSLLLLVSIILYPLGFSLYYSFQNWNLQITPVPLGFVGLANYANALRDPTFVQSFINTLKISIMATAIEFTLGLGIALLLSLNLRGGNVVRAILIMPTTVAPIVAGFLFRYLYYTDGLISYLLSSIGVSIPKQGILGSPLTAIWGIIFTDVWEWTPFFAIILLAGLQSISAEIIEAARVDGASFFRVFWHVMLPSLRFVASIIIMIRFMQVFNLFDIVYVETMGGPGTSTRTLSYNLYYEGLVNYNIGYSTAIAWIMIIIIAIIINLFIIFAFKEKEL